jgi:CubicO group peptidase (beta-lactamase class C family)
VPFVKLIPIILCSTALLLKAELPSATQAAIDHAVTGVLQDTLVPSASIAVVKDGKLEYAHAYGFARLDPKMPAAASMRYKIGSNSKQFVATAILMLAEEGKLSLNDPVSKYIPGLTRGKDITIRHLLTHTSGYQDYYPLDYVAPFMTHRATPQSIIDTWARKPLDFEPGAEWQYSNTNFTIAGIIIEQLTGKPLFDFWKTRIFDPLGMTTAIDAERVEWSASDPQGHTRNALGPVRAVPTEAPGWLFAAGPLAMSASDLARWDISLMNDALLKPESLEALTTSGKLNNGKSTGYGLGLGVGKTAAGHRRWAHGGGTAGFISQNVTYPDDKMAITVLTNGEAGAAGRIHHEIEQIMLEPAANAASASALANARKIYEGLAAGRVEHELLASDAIAYFSPQVVKDYEASLKPLGTPTQFRQTGSAERGGMTIRSYRVNTRTKTVVISTFVDPSGKFAQFLIYPTGE